MFRCARMFCARKTPLFQFQKDHLQPKMTDFAGYTMPLQFSGVLQEHSACRNGAALFDVSHMGQLRLQGKDRLAFLDKLLVTSPYKKSEGKSFLSLILDGEGGIIDDAIASIGIDSSYLVLNAANKHNDLKHFEVIKQIYFREGLDLTIIPLFDLCLLALQGPNATNLLSKIVDTARLEACFFMQHFWVTHQEFGQLMICRCGYTGEDGFEISVEPQRAVHLYQRLIAQGAVPAGLASRDALRLEAGLCLHGHDISAAVTPSEAGLNWLVKKEAPYHGKEGHERRAKQAVNKRVAFEMNLGIARQGAEVIGSEGQAIGKVTSGTFSPVLKKGVGFCYAPKDTKMGHELTFKQRGQKLQGKSSKTPFVPTRQRKY